MRVFSALLITVFLAGSVGAEQIKFIHEGSASGILDGVPFDVVSFVITAVGDTTNRGNIDGTAYWIDHDEAQIELIGLGTFNFLTTTRTFVNNSIALVGFSRSGETGNDLFNGPTHPDFASWDMLTSTGPHSGAGQVLQWDPDDNEAVITSGGILELFNQGSPATFTAIIPEPASALLAGCSLLLLALRRI